MEGGKSGNVFTALAHTRATGASSAVINSRQTCLTRQARTRGASTSPLSGINIAIVRRNNCRNILPKSKISATGIELRFSVKYNMIRWKGQRIVYKDSDFVMFPLKSEKLLDLKGMELSFNQKVKIYDAN